MSRNNKKGRTMKCRNCNKEIPVNSPTRCFCVCTKCFEWIREHNTSDKHELKFATKATKEEEKRLLRALEKANTEFFELVYGELGEEDFATPIHMLMVTCIHQCALLNEQRNNEPRMTQSQFQREFTRKVLAWLTVFMKDKWTW